MVTKVVVLGASGNAGSEIVKELSSRGTYDIVGVARHAEKIPKEKGLTAVAADASKPDELAKVVKGADVVISALHHDIKEPLLFEGIKAGGVKRVIIVGGAASLRVSPDGPRLLDTKEFPDEFKPFALQAIDFLNDLKSEKVVDWTFYSPPAFIEPGPRVGKFRTGTTILITDEQGNSKISFADFAIAIVDELEAHKHPYSQTTAAY